MVEYKKGKVKPVAKTYAATVDDMVALKGLKQDAGYKILEKWLIDRRKEGLDPLLVDTTLSSDDVKMQVVLQRFKVEFINAIFDYMSVIISAGEKIEATLGDGKVVPDDTIIKP